MIKIPENMLEYFKLQRTDAEDYPLSVEKGITNCGKDMQKVLDIKPRGKAIIDIGCGLGIMLAHLTDEFENIHLLDKTALQNKKRLIGYGPSSNMGFYTDLEFAENLVKANTKSNVKSFTPDNMPYYKYDVIMSFYSWGFHYPIETYGDWAVSCLKDDGIIILTARSDRLNLMIPYLCSKDFVITSIETRRASELIYVQKA